MMIGDLFGTIKTALQYKTAISAAIDAINENKSIPEVVKAFSEETDNKLDDEVAEDIGEHISDVAEGLDSIAKFVNELAELTERHAPSVIQGTRTLVYFLEDNSEKIQDTLHKVSKAAGEYSDKIEAMASESTEVNN